MFRAKSYQNPDYRIPAFGGKFPMQISHIKEQLLKRRREILEQREKNIESWNILHEPEVELEEQAAKENILRLRLGQGPGENLYRQRHAGNDNGPIDPRRAG
jgi:hypothetical protein